ncbi:TRAP transporter substrate-binding protein DctP [Rhodococcus sp. DMU1]|uniref:TRAP transporter substrate-binding protein DctP n=1 Tax=Rhodococcus sp. DMU1 TaxID=2722825 RepID=UPI00143E16D7|nr:TRAP transporter substrate-binding protein DctP [Rhodococcus sp. DMU1]QIX53856.1 TRAP transporter substrate-binding protein DctP [Rhodococcus sp. DMU1]
MTPAAEVGLLRKVNHMFVRYKAVRGAVGLAALALTLSACAGAGGGSTATSLEEMEPTTLSLHTAVPVGSPDGKALTAFAEDVAEQTGGKVEIENYFSGSLVAGDQDLQAFKAGVADMGMLLSSYHPQDLPVANWFGQMQSLRSDSTPHGFLQARASLARMWSTSDALNQEIEAHNLVALGAPTVGTNFGLLCTKPVTSPEEAKGVSVRTGGPTWSNEAAAMGFTPVSMSILEAYDAMQRGVIQCVMGSATTQMAYGFWDIAKYWHSVSTSGTAATVLVVNANTWRSLPPDVQQIIQNAANTYSGRAMQNGLDDYRIFGEEAKERGVTFVDPRPLNKPLDEHQATVMGELASTAPATVTDPDRFIDDWRAALDWGMEVAVDNVGREPNESYAPDDILNGYLTGPDDFDLEAFTAAVRGNAGN